jgi:Tfp pilus assembly protein PilP
MFWGLSPGFILCDETANRRKLCNSGTMAELEAALAGAKATRPEALDLSSLAVIGVIDGHAGVTALLRSGNGQIARVKAGDTAFGHTITAIGDDRILTTDRWGRTQTLALPRG